MFVVYLPPAHAVQLTAPAMGEYLASEQFLHIDEDNDYVLKSVPCTFLDADNQCSIYHVRPKACREYPHTNRIKQHQLLKLTEKNVSICPAVFQITEQLKKQLTWIIRTAIKHIEII